MKRPSVILIRESEEQLTGSGCCGRLEGEFLRCGDGRRVFAERRTAMERMGPLYRGLRRGYGDSVEIQVLDPRNVSLLFILLRDFLRYRVGLREAMRTLVDLPVQAVVVNGRLVARSEWPPLEDVAGLLDAELGRVAPPPAAIRTSGLGSA